MPELLRRPGAQSCNLAVLGGVSDAFYGRRPKSPQEVGFQLVLRGHSEWEASNG